MRRPWRLTAAIVFALTLLLGGLFGDRVLAVTAEARDVLRVYTELVSAAHDNYPAERSYEELVNASIQGVVRTLDPHTSFLSAAAFDEMRNRQQSTFSGLGILVGMRNGRLTVITPIEGTPASRLGIRAGDIISSIEGEPTEAMSVDDAVARLKGPRGTSVKIEIVRHSLPEPLALEITRAEIPQNTVRYAYMIAPGTGYIAVSDFNRGTGKEVRDAVALLKGQGMKRLLLDLRNNGGGLLDQAVVVSDQFVPAGGKIVETRGRTRDSFQDFQSSDRYEDLDLPVVVLVSDGTASAAEILAGAIQDHDIGLIVGTPTWGKGLVQTVYSLSYGNGLAVTTAKYYTPSGRLIQRDYTSWFDYASYRSSGEGARGPVVADAGDRETYYTDLGREVYGEGGIQPDVIVEPHTVAPFVQFLLSRNAFFDFAVEYTEDREIESRDWQPPADLLERFEDWTIQRELATREEIEEGLAGEEDRVQSRRYLLAEILNSAFGIEARYQVLAEGDNQIARALELFDEAADLLARRQGLEAATRTTSLGPLR
ncbi:MAG: S41 family peptidase [Acidobacteriota bacterium]|nr:S41 family peptidase [Acidobacteriota bacterium]